jgi:hypothetical protein
VKFWWFADYIQYDNQRKLQKKHPRFFSERIHATADSFISKNEGMNEGILRNMVFGITSRFSKISSARRNSRRHGWR